MSKLLFNIHDMTLILVIAACLLHVFTLYSQAKKQQYQAFLCLFLTSVAIATFDTLIYWSDEIKLQLSPLSPHIFFIFKFSLFIQAPLLYFFTKSLIYSDFKFKKSDYYHFLPAVLYMVCIPIIYATMGPENLQQSISNYLTLYNNNIFRLFLWGSKISFVAYGFLAFWILKTHKDRLKNIKSNTEGIDGQWLQLLVIGFLLLWLWGTITQLLTQINLQAHFLALSQNYFRFFIVNVLVFLSVSRSHDMHSQSVTEKETALSSAQTYTEEQVERVNDAMKNRKVYLDPDLSLEQLSEITSLPQRLLSSIVNRQFEKNFFEFVNYYRVEHAKSLLNDKNKKISMLDVMAESGFNSKSAFNRFFKKFTGMTPTQYKSKA